MARNLYEIIKANQQAGATGPGQRTQDFRQAVLAKSGKAAPMSTGPQKSAVAEQAAVQEGQAQQQVLGIQEQQQNMALEQQERGVEQQTQQQMRKLQTASDDQTAKYLRQVSNIAQGLQQSMGEINQQRQNTQIEQAGFLLGLSNKKYVQELEQAGNMKRLYDKASFEQELFKSALDSDYDLYVNNRQYQKLFNSRARDFTKELAEMGVREKLDLMRQQIAGQNTRAMFEGGGKAAGAVVDYAQKNPEAFESSGEGNMRTRVQPEEE